MSRQNTVEIIVKTKDATGTGLDSVRKKFAKQGQEVKQELDKTEAIVAKSGKRIGENLGKGIADGTKSAGVKVAEAAEKLARDLAVAETAAYKEAAKRRAAEQKATQKQVERLHREIAAAEVAAYKEVEKRRADAEKTAAKQRATEEKTAAQHAKNIQKIQSEAKGSGARWAVEFGKSAVGTLSAVLATPFGAGAAAAGLSLGAGVVGGLTTAMVGLGAVGLGAYLLKDNKQVKDTWTKTFKGIADDSKKAAGVMADEFVAAGKKTADIWTKDVKPSVESIFKNAQPLVDKLTTGLGKAVSDFLPGVAEAVKNSGPAVDGFTKLVGTLLKDTGDGLADLSTHSDDLGKSLELAGDGLGSVIKGTLGFMGDLSEAVATNEDDFRRWGKNISGAADGVGKDILRLTDLFAATGGDWKTGDGTSFGEAARRLLEGGEDKFDPSKPDPDDMLFGPLLGKSDLNAQKPALNVKFADEAYRRQDEAISKLSASMSGLNQLKGLGIELTNEELNKTDGLMSRQQALVTSLQGTSKATGDQTSANRTALASMLDIAAAGYPVHDSLMQVVSGMSDAQLAALGATVTTDALGRSVINIPGEKPITLTADATRANPPIDGVIGRLSQVQNKNVNINVTTTYAVRGDPNTGKGLGAGTVLRENVYFNKGGWVGGSGGDYDSQPALLTPGEFVVTRKAAQEHGGLLEQINQSAGGSLQLTAAGAGGGVMGAGAAGGAQTVRVVLSWEGSGDLFELLKRGVRVRGGNPAVFG